MAHATPADVMLMTPEEFLVCSVPDGKAELVRGELRVTPPAGGPHGRAATNVFVLRYAYVGPRALGSVFTNGVGYLLVDSRVRSAPLTPRTCAPIACPWRALVLAFCDSHPTWQSRNCRQVNRHPS